MQVSITLSEDSEKNVARQIFPDSKEIDSGLLMFQVDFDHVYVILASLNNYGVPMPHSLPAQQPAMPASPDSLESQSPPLS